MFSLSNNFYINNSDESYTFGKALPGWKEEEAQTLTFIVTEDCNLRCKYCYITHKKTEKKLELETAQKFINYILKSDISSKEAVIIEFIGGEPFLEPVIIDEIVDYFKIESYKINHKWYWNYKISISTNGINYSDPRVQKFIQKNLGKLSIGMTIDGNKEKHDLQRVYPDGKGSYDSVMKNIPLWINQMGGATKVTFASDDLKLLKDSIISLWNQNIDMVAANVVFENVWKDDDDKILEEQLVALADYVIDNRLFNKYYCTFFDENLGGYYNKEDLNKTYCGAGKMMALGANGNIYPCIRYKDYSLNKHPELTVGNINSGIDMEKARPFAIAMTKYQSDSECKNCEIANGCGFCQGFNYDEAETETNFSRAKYICKMHKARVRANNYYFAKLYNMYGIRKNVLPKKYKSLYFLLADDYVTYCSCDNKNYPSTIMNKTDILDGLKYAHENFFNPIFVHSRSKWIIEEDFEELLNYHILHIIPIDLAIKNKNKLPRDYILVLEEKNISKINEKLNQCIFNVEAKNINRLSNLIIELFEKTDRIDCNILDITNKFDELEYQKQLEIICNYLITVNKEEQKKEFNLITDLCNLTEHKNCGAGDKSFSLAPNGKIYTCPSYYTNKREDVGSIKDKQLIVKSQILYKVDGSPLCSSCDAYHCENCININISNTNEINVSPSFQCRKSFIEREFARRYQSSNGLGKNIITKVNYRDPIHLIYKNVIEQKGYYKYKN